MAEAVKTDACSVDPKHYTVETENDRVRIVRVRYGPGEKSPMHSHPALSAVFLTDAHVRFTFPNGDSDEVKAPAGQTMMMDPVVHSPENLSSEPMEVILIEQKT